MKIHALPLIATGCLAVTINSCSPVGQRVDFSWFRDAASQPQPDGVAVESKPAAAPVPASEYPPPVMEDESSLPRPWWKGGFAQQQQRQSGPQTSGAFIPEDTTQTSWWEDLTGQGQSGAPAYVPEQEETAPDFSEPEMEEDSAPAAVGAFTYTVQKGDTLSRIAARHKVTQTAIIQANTLPNPHALRVGQQLTIPSQGSRPAAPARATGSASGTHTVQAGETLSRIAARYSTSIQKIAELNGFTDAQIHNLKIGQIILVPTSNR